MNVDNMPIDMCGMFVRYKGQDISEGGVPTHPHGINMKPVDNPLWVWVEGNPRVHFGGPTWKPVLVEQVQVYTYWVRVQVTPKLPMG
jgi:hypothetical protein